MNTNENTRNNAPEDVIVLGIASVETLEPPRDSWRLFGLSQASTVAA